MASYLEPRPFAYALAELKVSIAFSSVYFFAAVSADKAEPLISYPVTISFVYAFALDSAVDETLSAYAFALDSAVDETLSACAFALDSAKFQALILSLVIASIISLLS